MNLFTINEIKFLLDVLDFYKTGLKSSEKQLRSLLGDKTYDNNSELSNNLTIKLLKLKLEKEGKL